MTQIDLFQPGVCQSVPGQTGLWFVLVPYEQVVMGSYPQSRRLAIAPASLGNGVCLFAESECLGNQALVKVRSGTGVFAVISANRWFRFPASSLAATGFNPSQQTAITAVLLAAGYSQAEVDAAIPDWQTATMRAVLTLLLTRRRTPRLDNGVIVLDGEERACLPISVVDAGVS